MGRIGWICLGALGLTLAGCRCGTDPASQAPTCAPSTACSEDLDCPERHLCREKDGLSCCTRITRTCATPSDCCPGQACAAGQCRDSFQGCTQDADCGGAGRVCAPWTDPVLGTAGRCAFAPCDPSGGCAAGLVCFAGACVETAPCNGSCPAGTACVLATNLCAPTGSRCALPPKPGFLVTLTDPANVWDVCVLTGVACAYEELPPLPLTDQGRHASVAARDGQVFVSYDGQYGDLVVRHFDADGRLLSAEWVDGVPADAPVVASPQGPRGGVAEPGPDVGKFTDLALRGDGTLFVSYYDQTNRTLKLATRAADGTWATPFAVDPAVADLGLYTSLALDASGRPAIAYFQRAGSDDPSAASAACPAGPQALLTALKVALAKVDLPASADDFRVEVVECQARPAPAGPGRPLSDLPGGTGLFPSLAFKGSTPVVAFYDHNHGDLKAAERGASTWRVVVLDGREGTTETGDVGRFPSLAVDASGRYFLAYQDLGRHAVRFWTGTSLTPLTGQASPPGSAFVDTGLYAPAGDGPSLVGADTALGLLGTRLFVAYQNATAGDLLLRERLVASDGKVTFRQVTAFTEGALGFFADAAAMNGRLYLAHARLKARKGAAGPKTDHTLRLEVLAP